MKHDTTEFTVLDFDGAFVIKHNPTNSVAEASFVDDAYDDLLDETRVGTGGCAFFNRLLSNKPHEGIGGDLVDLLLEHCTVNDITMICQVNAYGELTQEQLTEFYIRHGFEPINPDIPEALIYYPRKEGNGDGIARV